MAADEGDGSSTISLAEKVSAVAAAITALGAFIVIPGSLVMYLRLRRAHLPADLGVVASLPHQFLVALGLGYVIGPLLLVVALAVAVAWVPGREERLSLPAEKGGHESRWVRGGLLATFVAAVGFGFPFAVFGGSPPGRAFGFSFGAGVVFAIAVYLLGRYQTTGQHKLDRGVAFVIIALLAVFIFVGWAIAFAAVRGELQPTTICLKGDRQVNGVLIGRTSDEFFVGEPQDRATLLAVPKGPVQSNITGGLRAANIGVAVVGTPGSVTFQRTSVIITDLSQPHALTELKGPIDAGVPVLGYYEGDSLTDSEKRRAKRDGVGVLATETDVRNPALLKLKVTEALQLRPADLPKPARRIAEVPSSQVTGYRLGAAGPCPVQS